MIVASFCLCLLIYYRVSVSQQFDENKWDPSNLYGAVFDWSSIQSAFIFAIYGFIVTKKDGFAGAIVGGQTYERFLSFTRRACLGGFVLTIVTLPLVIASPAVSGASRIEYYSIALWFSFFVWAFGAFMRVAFSFGIIVATPDRPEHIPG